YTHVDVVALAALFSGLAFLYAGSLLELAVKLLNFPADGARLSDAICRSLSHVIGHDIICPVGGNLDAEEFCFHDGWEAFELYQLTLFQGELIPFQLDDWSVGDFSAVRVGPSPLKSSLSL
ncbi:MAG: hypothetical protein WAW80_03300, partial [Candidatus Saccharimonadales bacterium]